jgi:hypothetical protein
MSTEELPRVVYMMGAGASMQALPMVRDIPKALDTHLKLIDRLTPGHAVAGDLILPGVDGSHRNTVIGKYRELIQMLADRSANHESIDTYAKKLFLRSITERAFTKELGSLKLGFSLFMAFLQAKHGRADRRYDGFLASLLGHDDDRRLSLPSDVFILNWNYDQQLAIAYKEYVRSGSIESGIQQLGIRPLAMMSLKRSTPIRVVQLNGLFCNKGEFDDILPLLEPESNKEEQLFDEILRQFARHTVPGLPKRALPLMRFAWEVDHDHAEQLELVLARLKNVRELVIIGYSFPFFNRAIDRKLLQHMPSLKHIYAQAPDGAAQDILRTVQTMDSPPNCKLEPYTATEKFFLPPGL